VSTSPGPRVHGGVHSILDHPSPYLFIDACMQIWPDADFPNLHRHGATAFAVTAWRPRTDLDGALRDCLEWHRLARRYPNLVVVDGVQDIRRARDDGRAALVLAAQGGDWIGKDLYRIEALYRLGLRMMLPAYNASNLICDGCLDRSNGGLTRFGQLVVDECNRLGIVLDGTHVGKRSSLEIIDRSAKPCVFSHSNPSALVPNPRNIDDEQIAACLARGGVVALAPWGPLVLGPDMTRRPTVDDFIDLVDHVAALAGDTEHIAIGTDASIGTYPEYWHDPWGEPDYPAVTARYDAVVTPDRRSALRQVEGFDDYAEIEVFAARFLERGYSDEDVHRILGGNLLRVFEAVWVDRPR